MKKDPAMKMAKKTPMKKATAKQVAMAKAILAKAGKEEGAAMKLKAKPAMKMMKKK